MSRIGGLDTKANHRCLGFTLAFAFMLLASSVSVGNATSQTTIPSVVLDGQGFQAMKLAVTPQGYDDIGHILDNLGYSYDSIQVSDLDNLTLLSTYDVVFINCASGIDDYAETAGPVLKSYVEAGGVIYASDWACAPIDNAFDSAIGFYGEENWEGSKIGWSQTTTANVVDSGFAAYLGSSTTTVEFDLSSWVVIESVPNTTKQYLAGTVNTDEESMYVPITVSFNKGSGSVIYTSFHYEAQGVLAQKLMEYLVFKAVTETVASSVQSSLTAEGYSIAYDIRGAINQGETENYNITIAEPTDVKIVLDWHGSSLGLSVRTPAGATLPSTGTKPKYVEITGASAGTYVVSVTGVDVPTQNEPFTLAVGTGTPSAPAGEFPWLLVAIGAIILVVIVVIAILVKTLVK